MKKDWFPRAAGFERSVNNDVVIAITNAASVRTRRDIYSCTVSLSLSLSLSLARARGRVFNIVGRSSMKGIHLWWEKKPWPLWSYNDISFDSVSKLLPCCVAEMKYGERYDSRRGSSTRNLPFSLIFERRKRIRSLIKLNDAALSWVIRKGSGSRFDERSALG